LSMGGNSGAGEAQDCMKINNKEITKNLIRYKFDCTSFTLQMTPSH